MLSVFPSCVFCFYCFTFYFEGSVPTCVSSGIRFLPVTTLMSLSVVSLSAPLWCVQLSPVDCSTRLQSIFVCFWAPFVFIRLVFWTLARTLTSLRVSFVDMSADLDRLPGFDLCLPFPLISLFELVHCSLLCGVNFGPKLCSQCFPAVMT